MVKLFKLISSFHPDYHLSILRNIYINIIVYEYLSGASCSWMYGFLIHNFFEIITKENTQYLSD